MSHLCGPPCDDDPHEVLPFPTRTQVRDLAGDADLNALLRRYESEAQRMYDNRTAGDHSWLGLLASFAFELAAARS